MNLKRCQASCRQLFGKVDKFLIINLEVWTRDNNLFFFSEYALCVTFYQKRLIKHNFTLSTICLHQYMQVYFMIVVSNHERGLLKQQYRRKLGIHILIAYVWAHFEIVRIYQSDVYKPNMPQLTLNSPPFWCLFCMMGKMSVLQKTGTFKLKIPT